MQTFDQPMDPVALSSPPTNPLILPNERPPLSPPEYNFGYSDSPLPISAVTNHLLLNGARQHANVARPSVANLPAMHNQTPPMGVHDQQQQQQQQPKRIYGTRPNPYRNLPPPIELRPGMTFPGTQMTYTPYRPQAGQQQQQQQQFPANRMHWVNGQPPQMECRWICGYGGQPQTVTGDKLPNLEIPSFPKQQPAPLYMILIFPSFSVAGCFCSANLVYLIWEFDVKIFFGAFTDLLVSVRIKLPIFFSTPYPPSYLPHVTSAWKIFGKIQCTKKSVLFYDWIKWTSASKLITLRPIIDNQFQLVFQVVAAIIALLSVEVCRRFFISHENMTIDWAVHSEIKFLFYCWT